MLKLNFFFAKYVLAAVLFTFSVKAVQFDCHFQTVNNKWSGLGTCYACSATVNNSSSTSVESVTGVHEARKSNNDINYLRIVNQHLPLFPEGIANFFKNLDSFYIYNTSLTSITANDLRPFPHLKFLHLAVNQLTSIDGHLFALAPLLRFVSFADNQIQHIGHGLATNLTDRSICVLNSMFASIKAQMLQSQHKRLHVNCQFCAYHWMSQQP